VQALQRKHEGLERDLAALGEKVTGNLDWEFPTVFYGLMMTQIKQLDDAATRLRQTHPEAAQQISELQKQLNEQWMYLTSKANSRKDKLLDSYDYQRFLSDYRCA